MKLQNISKQDFVTIFGEEALDIIKPCKGKVCVVRAGDYPAFDMQPEFSAAAVMFDHQDGKGPVPTVFINPDKCLACLGELTTEEFRQRFLRGMLVHEMVHIKQGEDDRLDQKDGICYWEGEVIEFPTNMVNYYNSPWEVEAYLAQYMYQYNCSKEIAEEYRQAYKPS